MSTIIRNDLPKIELDKPTALKYLKKENIQIKSETMGWKLAIYEGLNLGWMKILKNRVNNYYPKSWRIF